MFTLAGVVFHHKSQISMTISFAQGRKGATNNKGVPVTSSYTALSP